MFLFILLIKQESLILITLNIILYLMLMNSILHHRASILNEKLVVEVVSMMITQSFVLI